MRKLVSKLTRQTASIFAGAVIVLAQLVAPAAVFANGNGSTAECWSNQNNNPSNYQNVFGDVTGTADLVTKDVGMTKVVEGVCIKSGGNMFGNAKHSTVLGNGTYSGLSEDGGSPDPACYTVNGVGTQIVTVTRVANSNTCQGISHIDVVTRTVVLPVDYCDPSQKPGGTGIDNWVPKDEHCVTPWVELDCGVFTAGVDSSVKATWGDDYGIVWSEGAPDYNQFTPPPANFPEDYNGGSVTVYYWIVGPEAGYVKGHGFPNFWDQNAASVVVNTDCQQAPRLGKIRGFKFNDLNGNGKFDKNDGETKLSGWTIFIDENANGVLDQGEVSRVTNANGGYAFRNLPAGDYRICEVQQAGWTATTPATGCQDVTLGAGEDKKGVKFGNREDPQTPPSTPTPTPTTPQVLGDTDEKDEFVPQTLSTSTLADTGEAETSRNGVLALSLMGAALATVFSRRKEKTEA